MRDARFYVDFIGGGRGTDMNGHEKMKKINRVRKRGREREREKEHGDQPNGHRIYIVVGSDGKSPKPKPNSRNYQPKENSDVLLHDIHVLHSLEMRPQQI